jgi:hypothetical protein
MIGPTVCKPRCALALLLTAFVGLQFFLPLQTTIQIGGDEGFELAKATLCLKGHKLYSEVWNDQPPLHTFLVTQILKHASPSILGPRLLTSAFAALLLSSVFTLVLRSNGLLTASLATAMLLASPAFLGLSCSCMLEIPALSVGIAALCVLVAMKPAKWSSCEILSGILFGVALQIKLVPLVLLPVAALLVWLGHQPTPWFTSLKQSDVRCALLKSARSMLVLGASLSVSYVAVDWAIERGAYLTHFHQTWTSHFASAKSFEYGSAADHPFDWSVLLKNWDTTVPAVLGVFILLIQVRKAPSAIIPLAWLALSFIVFGTHKPWWSYYYVHTSIPLCWCAGIGIADLFRRVPAPPDAPQPKTVGRQVTVANAAFGVGREHARRARWVAVLMVYGLCALPWMASRLCLQISEIRNSPQTYNTLVLGAMQRFRPFTKWIYTDEPIYSFHSGIPLPPDLAVVMLKRLWSGEMTNARIAEELTAYKPGLILLRNNGLPMPFQNLIEHEYRLVYVDTDHRLYALRAISKKPAF